MTAPTEAARTPSRDLDAAFAEQILPLVSRTFAPAIAMLPPALVPSVRTGYLLCRIADTIEDATRLPSRTRQDWLRRFARLLRAEGASGTEGPSASEDASAADGASGTDRSSSVERASDAGAALLAEEVACALRGNDPEVELVVRLPAVLRLLSREDAGEQEAIRRWTAEMALGMARFLDLEPPEDAASGWTALRTIEELNAYEYYVAGTVGSLLDSLFHLHVPPLPRERREASRRLAVSFGLGLQGVNVIQDLSDDRARGWCYLPEEIARRHGTSTARLHLPGEREAAMRAVRDMARRACKSLDDGLRYTALLPEAEPRVRLFCFWPLTLALRTLERIVASPAVLGARVRIPRADAGELLDAARAAAGSNPEIEAIYARERARLEVTLDRSQR